MTQKEVLKHASKPLNALARYSHFLNEWTDFQRKTNYTFTTTVDSEYDVNVEGKYRFKPTKECRKQRKIEK